MRLRAWHERADAQSWVFVALGLALLTSMTARLPGIGWNRSAPDEAMGMASGALTPRWSAELPQPDADWVGETAGSYRPAAVTWQSNVHGTGGDGVNMRRGASLQAPIVGAVREGAPLVVFSEAFRDGHARSWYRVAVDGTDGLVGWVDARFVQPFADPTGLAHNNPGAVASSAMAQPHGVEPTDAAAPLLIESRITGYTFQEPGGGAHGTITRTGTPARWGEVAVDPSVIPLGSRVVIEGFDQVFLAEDTGFGVRGAHVDVFFWDEASALRFGSQRRTVTVLP